MNNLLKDTSNEKMATVAKIIENIKVGMLSTTDKAGRVVSRPMTVLEIDQEGSLWFFTSSKSHLVQEIIKNPLLNITFSDSSKNEYLSATAIAYEVYDRARIHQLWSPVFKAWFYEGAESPDITLLKLDLQEIEYWDSPSSAVVKISGLLQLIAGDKPDMERHERIDFNQKNY